MCEFTICKNKNETICIFYNTVILSLFYKVITDQFINNFVVFDLIFKMYS